MSTSIRRRSAMFLFLAAVLIVAGASSTASAQTWSLNWADEFNGTGAANSANWEYEVGGHGWGNGELEYYTGPNNVPPGGLNGQQGGGTFNIQLRQESYGGNPYTSTRLITRGKKDFGPGDATPVKFEGRFGNVVKGQGTWPAFWMLGIDIATIPWPDSGEIDILETINNDTTAITTIHWNSGAGHASWGPAAFTNVNYAAYHTFGITWTAAEIRWWLDGVTNGAADIANNVNSTNEFHRPFFALMNVAIGGSWPGAPTSALVLPKTMNCDWVRYSTGGGGPTPTTPPAATPTATTPPAATPTATTPPTGGTNLALNKAVTVSSTENAGTAGNLAVDGNAGTRWASAFSDPQWIRVDLGATTSINRVVLNWEAAFGKSYQIQTSTDGTNFTTVYTTTTGDGGIDDLTLSGSGRYVRMYGTVRATGYGYSLWEIQIYGGGAATPTSTARPTATATAARATATATATTARATATATSGAAVLLSQGHPVVASSAENAGTAATAAVDGNAGTRWSSAFSDPQWIRVDLGAPHPVSRVQLNWEAAYGKSFQLQSSNDAVTWSTFYTTTTSTGGNQNLAVTANGRYIRMYGTVRATAYGYSLWEFQVYGN